MFFIFRCVLAGDLIVRWQIPECLRFTLSFSYVFLLFIGAGLNPLILDAARQAYQH